MALFNTYDKNSYNRSISSGKGTSKPYQNALVSTNKQPVSRNINNENPRYSSTYSLNNLIGNNGSSLPSYQNQLMSYFKEQNEKARQSAIDAINQRVNSQTGQYQSQLNDLSNQYQALRNQSEVERYKAKQSMREALANRGQLESGYGRQENLIMNSQFGNSINSINMQEQRAKEDIRNLISQLKAEAEADKNAINNQYNQAISQAMASIGSF